MQCEEIGNRDIWKKSWHDKTPDADEKGRVYAGPYHPPNGKKTSSEPTDKHTWHGVLGPDTIEPGALCSQKRKDVPHRAPYLAKAREGGKVGTPTSYRNWLLLEVTG